ncbi:MAG: hypothetical protein KF685_05390 [Acidobacteria bacterium]|nr:hypothetical protein [Acidobacteriota bacterium]
MLIKNKTLEKIVAGEITLLFRRWKRQSVKVGGTQITQLGVLKVESVNAVMPERINTKDARSAGFESVETLLASLPKISDPIYRIKVSFVGEDPRIALRQENELSENEVDSVINKLLKMDVRSSNGAWTRRFLSLIKEHPHTRAAELADLVSIETLRFKSMVRKLKALGLTESLDVGYCLSPRGERILKEFIK